MNERHEQGVKGGVRERVGCGVQKGAGRTLMSSTLVNSRARSVSGLRALNAFFAADRNVCKRHTWSSSC